MNLLRALFLFDGGDTSASHPGRVMAQHLRVATSYPLWPTVLGIFWLLSLAAALDRFTPEGLTLLGVATYMNYAWWGSIRPWFRSGDVCAGVVVSEDPLLVATYTDLSTGDGEYPVVKIQREPAKRFANSSGKYGKRVVSVSRYEGIAATTSWLNFYPRAVQCATDDPAEIQRLLGEIEPERWELLQQCVKKLPRPFQPGLYRLTDSE
jgi:hypothetical protein